MVSTINRIPMGATDCSLPFVWATKNKVKVDVFIVYTDNETYHGSQHPSEVSFSCNLVIYICLLGILISARFFYVNTVHPR